MLNNFLFINYYVTSVVKSCIFVVCYTRSLQKLFSFLNLNRLLIVCHGLNLVTLSEVSPLLNIRHPILDINLLERKIFIYDILKIGQLDISGFFPISLHFMKNQQYFFAVYKRRDVL